MPTPFDRNQFIRVLWSAKLAHRITPTAYLIGRAMLRRACRKGSLWPSQATIAGDVGCSERTVGRALPSLSALGLLSWQRRPGRGRRYATNLYRLASPRVELPFAPRERARRKEGMIFESSSAIVSDGSARTRPTAPRQPFLPLDWCPPPAISAAAAARRVALQAAIRAERGLTKGAV